MSITQKVFLLADDDIDDREMFSDALRSIDSGITCIAVTEGREVLTTLQGMDQLPDLIFLDVNMPVMNGWQCLERLKNDPPYTSIPVIIISTSSNQRELALAKQLGALCYLTKPDDFGQLTEVLRQLVASLDTGR